MRKLASALLGLALVLGQPALVAATAYSPLEYGAKWFVPGASSYASVCNQAGIIDVAGNYAQTVIKNWVSGSCSGANKSVPAGYIGTSFYGFRDGSNCGYTGIYYSTSTTSAWQLWASLCSNPAGNQAFYTLGYGWYWDGAGYQVIGGTSSPNQNY